MHTNHIDTLRQRKTEILNAIKTMREELERVSQTIYDIEASHEYQKVQNAP